MSVKERIKKYSFWTGLSAALIIFANNLGEIFGFTISQEAITGLVMAVCQILIVFGIVKKDKDNTVEKVEESMERIKENITKESEGGIDKKEKDTEPKQEKQDKTVK